LERAQSGAQIAEELYQSGRKVYLSIGSAGRVPRRYRGRTLVTGLRGSVISGKNGGESLNLHQFARDGVLLGHVRDARDGQIILGAPT
jgi:putative flavoprotein involved in K+ transport